MSSANNINIVIFKVLAISFMKIKYNTGPCVEPCATQHVIEANLEFILVIETLFTIYQNIYEPLWNSSSYFAQKFVSSAWVRGLTIMTTSTRRWSTSEKINTGTAFDVWLVNRLTSLIASMSGWSALYAYIFKLTEANFDLLLTTFTGLAASRFC